MESEAALVPPEIRLNSATRQYTFQALKLAEKHPIFKKIWATLKETSLTEDYSELAAEKSLIRTQIDRIQLSIHRLVDFSNLESIKLYFFTPWDTISYSVNISQLTKEKEAENHKNSAILLAPN
jgi:hypothetical protein